MKFPRYVPIVAALIVLPVAATAQAPAGKRIAPPPAVSAVRATDFLDSIGTQSAISVRGESLPKTIECAKFLGVRWMRAGIEGSVPLEHFAQLHQQAGVRFSWGLGSGGADIDKLLKTGRQIAQMGALLAFEGPNEPNNWPVTYKGQVGGKNGSWLPVANLMNDLYQSVKSDSVLKSYPVWSISEGGAQTDNAGLQFLTIPPGADTLLPAGTKFADFANVHNYFYHPNSPSVEDNKTWNAADPTKACKVDGLYGEFGVTWARHFRGYSDSELLTLPRVTTETGTTIGGDVTEEIHGLNLLTLYLDQFKRGWSYTSNYLLRDRVDEGGNQQFGFFRPDYTPRKAAVYLHNLTTILADSGSLPKPGALRYTIANPPATVHDLLLQKSDRTFALVIWNERVKGADTVRVDLGDSCNSVKIYDPTIGAAPHEIHGAIRAVTLTLTDHPIILMLPAR